MPNWSEGILKVRGNYENVVKFFKENLQTVDLFGTNVESALIIDDYDDSVEINLKKTAYIKGTRRNFTESDYIYIYRRKDNTACVPIHIKGAWCIESNPYTKMSKDYDVDIKIESFERGMEFSQYILIEKGQLIENKEIRYDDYEWECPNPLIGG